MAAGRKQDQRTGVCVCVCVCVCVRALSLGQVFRNNFLSNRQFF